ncbi:hypothetical protein SDC9_106383 [bioreactor metagenome]|uniref:HTH tetR-type domain-containing protein n=1 Tax=bioreactor metagenome TaxID=1076179 RepID=A0A645B2A1_9ZZZZ
MRNKIIEEALREFNEKGYEGTSIRNIAKKSNTSVGNLYKYFKSKEELHENIVGSIYDRFVDYIKQFNRVELNEKAEVIFYKLADEIIEIFNKNNVEISVLLNKSKGTKYENCKSIFVDFITRIVTEKMEYELSLKGKKLEDNFIIQLISQSLVESIAIIVKKCSDGAEVKKFTLNLIHIFYTDLINKLQTEDIK